MRLVIMGLPYAGKGNPYGPVVGESLAYPILPLGAMFLPPKGQGASRPKDSPAHRPGGPVPDELVLAVVRARLEQDDCRDGFVLTGFRQR